MNVTASPTNVTEVLRARLNHNFTGLAIGLKSAQPIATAIILPGTQTLTPTTPQLPITLIPQPTATVTTPPGTQTPTPVTPPPPVASIPQQAVLTATQQQHYPQQPGQQQHTLLQFTRQQQPDPGRG